MQNDAYQTQHDIAAESAMLTGEHQDHLYVVGVCNGERFEAIFVKNAAGDFDTSWTPFRQCWLAGRRVDGFGDRSDRPYGTGHGGYVRRRKRTTVGQLSEGAPSLKNGTNGALSCG